VGKHTAGAGERERKWRRMEDRVREIKKKGREEVEDEEGGWKTEVGYKGQ
jgi:hypothetical protein